MVQSSSENSQRQYTPGGARRRIFLMISRATATEEAVRETAYRRWRLSPIQRRFAGRTAFEAAMLPEILFRHATDSPFD